MAGDTPVSDGPMLFRGTDVERGGLRVWVNRKDKYLVQIQAMQKGVQYYIPLGSAKGPGGARP